MNPIRNIYSKRKVKNVGRKFIGGMKRNIVRRRETRTKKLYSNKGTGSPKLPFTCKGHCASRNGIIH
jgi:hypothetical protein